MATRVGLAVALEVVFWMMPLGLSFLCKIPVPVPRVLVGTLIQDAKLDCNFSSFCILSIFVATNDVNKQAPRAEMK